MLESNISLIKTTIAPAGKWCTMCHQTVNASKSVCILVTPDEDSGEVYVHIGCTSRVLKYQKKFQAFPQRQGVMLIQTDILNQKTEEKAMKKMEDIVCAWKQPLLLKLTQTNCAISKRDSTCKDCGNWISGGTLRVKYGHSWLHLECIAKGYEGIDDRGFKEVLVRLGASEEEKNRLKKTIKKEKVKIE